MVDVDKDYQTEASEALRGEDSVRNDILRVSCYSSNTKEPDIECIPQNCTRLVFEMDRNKQDIASTLRFVLTRLV